MEMQHQVMGYDRASTMFSPDGRILQVEYAEKTVRLGSASIGMICSDGVVIVADKRIFDPLVLPESSMKIWEVDSHIISTASGILSDARVLIERAQVIAQQHRVTYDEPMDVESVIKDIANIKQAYTQYGGARPFGIEIMVAGINLDNSSKLYVSDVTGNYIGYNATAIGENDERVKEMLRESWREGITIEQGIKLALTIFKKVLGKNFNIERFEVAYIKKDEKKVKRVFGETLLKYTK
ncbi:MAG: archaeal proteasome endopeptidase complex subunit alpha [Candidatus Pacearchaeota archaeon]|nr:archaeal proteasome endopeptidase complex subunit alpha [Candidatus Pacearchaeota archaeon]